MRVCGCAKKYDALPKSNFKLPCLARENKIAYITF